MVDARLRLPRLFFGLSTAAILSMSVVPFASQARSGPTFEITVPAATRGEPTTGRVYVAISRLGEARTPIQQAGPTGAPLFSVAVDGLAPGAAVRIGPDALGHPLTSLGDRPLVVVTAEKEAEDGWTAAQAELVALSTNSIQRVVPDATHAMLTENEAAAAESSQAIRDVVNAVRTGTPVAG